jgi:hypothetical protein
MNELREADDICCHAQMHFQLVMFWLSAASTLIPFPPQSFTTRQLAPGRPYQMQTARQGGHTATRLIDGTVLVVGGYDDFGPVRSSELYEPATTSWSTTVPPETARGFIQPLSLPAVACW